MSVSHQRARHDRESGSSERERPIGIFDSGVGGLSVLREIRRELPTEDLLYVADSRFAPYGEKTEEWLLQRSSALIGFLLQQGAKAIVIACNTASAAAVAELRTRFTLPIIAIEPAIKPAALQTRSGVIGVLATPRTVASAKFSALLARFGDTVEILVQPSPGLVDKVEAGDLASDATRSLVASYVRPMVEQGADTVVLGCTHYPLLSAVIAQVAGPGVSLIDPAAAVSRELQRRLRSADLLCTRATPGRESFWTSGSLDRTGALIARLWSAHAGVHPLHALDAAAV